MIRTLLFVSLASLLTGCVTTQYIKPVAGPSVKSNYTPYTASLYCIDYTAKRSTKVAVGSITDLTGKYNAVKDNGSVVTRGTQQMVSTALGYLRNHVRVVERIDPSVIEYELERSMRKILGDTEGYRLVKAGGLLGSDYYITGAITELNFNIWSGGTELHIDGIGGKGRKYLLQMAGDFRLVDTRSSEVIRQVSLSKQIVGYEVEAGIVSFFDAIYVNFRAGEKMDEPLHYGVRTLAEAALAMLMPSVLDANTQCVREIQQRFPKFYDKMLASPQDIGWTVAYKLKHK